MIDLKREITVLDIGTTKICCAIASSQRKYEVESENLSQINRANLIRILGVGHQMSKGIKRNSISNLDELEGSLLQAITSAENESQKAIKSLFISIPTWVISCFDIETSVSLGSLPVDETHLHSIIDFDSSKYIGDDLEIIHVFPIAYSIDSVHGIQNPVGMVGETLSAILHVMVAPRPFIKNIKNCLERNNIEVNGFISSTYASGLASIIEDEINVGVTLIDIGGATTSIACFYEGSLLYLGYIPVGGQHVTSDIAMILRTSMSNAERLKILYGVATVQTNNEEQILVPKIDDYGDEYAQNIAKNTLDTIIHARLEEILKLAEKHIYSCGADQVMVQRIVITGGGSRVSGLTDLIKEKRLFPNSAVRLGKPIGVTGSHDFVRSASFSTVAGVVVYCVCQFLNNQAMRLSHVKKSFWQKLIIWFKRGV
jgi:cell division protein FtsA